MSFMVAPAALVVDASVAVEVLQGGDDWSLRWRRWLEEGAVLLVPAHFPAEVANGLLLGGRLPSMKVNSLLEQLERAGIEITDRHGPGLRRTVSLAERLGLTVYDAAYVDLALDVDGSLATLDRAMARAAAAEEVEVIDGSAP